MRKKLFALLFFAVSTNFVLAEGGSNNPEVTITPAWQSIQEGDSGTKYVKFTVAINECPTLLDIKVQAATQEGTAQEANDYERLVQDITFRAGNCVKTREISVAIKGDKTYEDDEQFQVNLNDNGTDKNVQTYHFGNKIAVVKILNDDEKEDNSADLSITKSNNISPKKASVGDVVTYTIVAKNNGPKDSKIFVWDSLPKNLEFISVDDSIKGIFGFFDNFNCEYNSNDRKIRCRGDRIFKAGDDVTITVKARVLNTKSLSIINYAGLKSDSSPKVPDNNTKNNRVRSAFKVKQLDIKVKKYVKDSNGNYRDNSKSPAQFQVRNRIRYKIQIQNRKEHQTQIEFTDTIPENLKLESVEVEGSPNDYQCDINNNTIHCYGNKLFGKNQKQNIFINVTALKKGAYVNSVSAGSNNNDIYHERNYANNSDDIMLYVGTTEEEEKGESFIKSIVNPKTSYQVGDTIKFKLSATSSGISSKYLIRDWENDNGTTENAFTFLNVSSDGNASMECTIENANDQANKFINCESKNNLKNNEQITIYLEAKIKKSGNICNKAYIYKEYQTSNGKDYIQIGDSEKCIIVDKPKEAPVLKANVFHVQLNKAMTIDLKKYTTDSDSDISLLKYSLVSGTLPSGFTITEKGVISGTYTDDNGTFPKEFEVEVKVVDPDGLYSTDKFKIVVEAEDIDAFNNYYDVAVNNAVSGNFITDSRSTGANPFKADIGKDLEVIKVLKSSSDMQLTWNKDGSFTYTAPSTEGRYNLSYTIKDKYGQTDTARVYFSVFKPKIKANDDILNVAKNTPLHANLFEDNGNGIDIGTDLKIKKYSKPAHGTLIIKENGDMVFTPEQNYIGDDSFSYTIEDKYGQTASATVYLKVGIQEVKGYVDFKLVNPPETRNLIGNYIVAGNTITCITEKRGTQTEQDSYNGVCQNNRDIANNDYVVKYIDIDNSSLTWNSSSAEFELPNSYLNLEDGKGIAWAGIFWQGSINNRDDGFKQRRAYSNGNGFSYFDINSSTPITIPSTDANKLLIKIDDKPYLEIKADTLYYDAAHGNYGGYYASYTNITEILQEMNLTKGKHTITVANLTTNEGRESNVGNYGGWSLVIIYKEDFSGKPRNISIYNGYQALGFGGNTHYPEKEITISGFKLPKTGDVDAQISAFVGEGEKKYGGTPLVYDKMYIKDLNQSKIYNMPVAYPNNIFDGAITNSEETPIPEQVNTNGIDIDNYDVSSIIKQIRDNKKDTNEIVIGLVSKDEDNQSRDDSDYVTASMLAFSTQLYAPKMCYDYTLSLHDYTNPYSSSISIPSEDRNFSVDNMDIPLEIKVMIKSQEADFDLIESKLSLSFIPDDVFSYIQNSAQYSPPNTTEYLQAIEIDSNKGEIAIGSNVNNEGGIIGEQETTYAKLYYMQNKETFEGKFDINVNAKISFDGINKVPYSMSTAANEDSIFYISRCPTNPTYDPVYGILNIERGDSSFTQPEAQRYSLYTQVVGVPYELTLASYKKDNNGKYTLENNLNAIFEVELINAGTFDNNASTGYDSICQDPDTYHSGTFINLKNKSRQKFRIPDDYEKYPSNLALKNAAFRVWVLTVKDENGTRKLAEIPNTILNTLGSFMSKVTGIKELELYPYYHQIYLRNYYNNKNETDYCQAECLPTSNPDPTSNACYQCLRKYYGMPICSRDNFSIRPQSYSIALVDTNQSIRNPNQKYIGLNDNTLKNISAGYVYKLETNATKANSRENVDGYYFRSYVGIKKEASAKYLNSGTNCNDTSDYKLRVLLRNGKARGIRQIDLNGNRMPKNGIIINNVANYAIHLEDNIWTEVDQANYPYKPFKGYSDCEENSTNIYFNEANKKRGCTIATNKGLDTLPDLKITLHPYKFDISGITADTTPHSNSNYLYISNLDRTKSLVSTNKIMALNIVGTIMAKGKNGKDLTNYVDGCMAQDSTINLEYTLDINDSTLKSSLNSNVAMQHFVYDTIKDANNYPETTKLAVVQKSGDMNATFSKKYFYDSGAGYFKEFINFERKFNEPINPFNLKVTSFSIKGTSNRSFADLSSSHIPTGEKDINITKTFYYAKVKSQKEFYDDISTNEVQTPIEIDIFCNKSLEYCQKYGIDTIHALTNEYEWWRNTQHNAQAGDGIVLLQTDKANVIVAPSSISNFDKGIDKNVTVKVLDGVSSLFSVSSSTQMLVKPDTVKIKPTQQMQQEYPYLLFNKDFNMIPPYIYKVRFVSPSAAWSGEGKTGFTIDENSSGQKTNRINW